MLIILNNILFIDYKSNKRKTYFIYFLKIKYTLN